MLYYLHAFLLTQVKQISCLHVYTFKNKDMEKQTFGTYNKAVSVETLACLTQ